MRYLLGIDTGGTYTDAALLDDDLAVRSTAKALTDRDDLLGSVTAAARKVLTGSVAEQVGLVSLSTTLATNALVEHQGARVCLVLIGYPTETLGRAGLREALGSDPVVFIEGGHNPFGETQATLELESARNAVLEHAARVSAFAVSGYFAVRNPEHERQVAALIHEMTNLPVSCGHELSSNLDAPRRALTTLLNARLIPMLQDLILAVRAMLAAEGVNAPLMVVKGDGSLVRDEVALAHPVETILSGPAASVVGARHLARARDVVVADMGGTTTDIAVLNDGSPVLDPDGACVGGWRTMVEAIQVHTFGLGGDSEIHFDVRGEGPVGPRRVVPLCLLAQQHPEVLVLLREEWESPSIRTHPACFVMRRKRLPTTTDTLSRNQRRVLERLGERPVELRELFRDQTLERPLEKLVERGMVVIGGLTPSDVTHAMGLHSAWCREASELALRIWRRRIEFDIQVHWEDDASFSLHLLNRITVSATRCIVRSALGQDVKGTRGGAAELIESALRGPDPATLLQLNFKLSKPLVGIGAPAAAYFPEVAARLGTELIVPHHADVANAVGAVAGGVVFRAQAHITPLGQTRCRVHAPDKIDDFDALEAAARWAESEVRKHAESSARNAGAVDIQIRVQREDNTARDDSGLEVFFGSEIKATAYGRPRIGVP